MSWSWDFGDSGSSTAQNPSHTYTAAGTYTVGLTVTDDDGGTDARSRSVTVSDPPPAPNIQLTVRAQTGSRLRSILEWTGASGARVDVHRDGSFLKSVTNDGFWKDKTVQDGQAYVYRVCLTGTSACSNEGTANFGATPPGNAPPTAGFGDACTLLSCDFTDASTDTDGSVVSWSWDFGDGGTSTAQNPTHVYATAGTYPVALTVTDDDGATDTASRSVTVSDGGPGPGPTIQLTVTVKTGSRLLGILEWTGATGPKVDVYRNGSFQKAVTNDRFWKDKTVQPGQSYAYRVCETGTAICSNEDTANF